MGWDHSVTGQEVVCRRGILCPAFWFYPAGGGEEIGGGGGKLKRTLWLPLLPKEVDAHAIFPLASGHAYVRLRKAFPPDTAVGGMY